MKDLEQRIIFEHGKVPPQAIDLEEAVLGALMLEDCFDRIVDTIKEEVFYREAHQLIFGVIRELNKDNEKIDILTVTQRLKKKGQLELIGGNYYVAQLTNRIISGANIESHAKIIAQKFIQREIIRVSSISIQKAFDDMTDPLELFNDVKRDFTVIDEYILSQSRPKKWEDHLLIFNSETDKRIKHAREGKPFGIPSGLKCVNDLINGWQNSELIILAGRPSMGKTSLALFFAKVAAKHNNSVDIYSLEMSSERLVQRMILGETDIPGGVYNTGKLTLAQVDELDKIISNVSAWGINLSEDKNATIERIRATSRINKNNGNCDLIIIDYLQLIEPDKTLQSREREISTISRKLKQMAIELDVPIILLSQLNRACEARSDKRPLLSDLRESGAIEQDADIVLFPYRTFYYTKDDHDKGKIEMEVAKNRNGNTGVVNFRHNDDINNFFEGNEIEYKETPF